MIKEIATRETTKKSKHGEETIIVIAKFIPAQFGAIPFFRGNLAL